MIQYPVVTNLTYISYHAIAQLKRKLTNTSMKTCNKNVQ